ncbi:helix-turn-helix domain-containing protein [Luteimicrobium xylanilyticum]|uniref:Bialaphos biosynthetic pathway regulatory protein n=1 Tax=Luteimicrobium xylanilyticum TaxID=1133546 RepID=A0A5P9QDV6_9MICO|nr:TrmB family transcriptional regulator sugar-binding domain-containing protein [Luteimicrobium xylanilyticum]QFU99644.1 Bialaphos biosynthetic pathway regulatory protein [Luteimicrobium xylanilyticum]
MGDVTRQEMWTLLGLEEVDELVYRALLEHPGRMPTDVAARAEVSFEEFDRSAATLVGLRLVRRVDDRLEALEPRAALTALARQRQSVLDQVGDVAQDLGMTFGAARLKADPATLFQVLRGRDEIVQRHIELVQAATSSIWVTATPPFITGTDEATDAVVQAALRRGVRIRVVYDTSALRDPVIYEYLAESAGRGEQTRVRPDLRTRLILVDEGTAMVPVVPETERSDPRAVVIARSSVTQALCELFEYHWAQAEPLHEHGDRGQRSDGAVDRELLVLLANGLTDQVIAHRLGCSERTLRRRIAELSTQLAATSRFQLGASAARRGLL